MKESNKFKQGITHKGVDKYNRFDKGVERKRERKREREKVY